MWSLIKSFFSWHNHSHSYPATAIICCMPYVDSVAPFLSVHICSLIWELHYLLINQYNPILQFVRQCIAHIRLCRWTGWCWLHCLHMAYYPTGYDFVQTLYINDVTRHFIPTVYLNISDKSYTCTIIHFRWWQWQFLKTWW